MTKQEAERLWQERAKEAETRQRLLNEHCKEFGYITPPKSEDAKSEATTMIAARQKQYWRPALHLLRRPPPRP